MVHGDTMAAESRGMMHKGKCIKSPAVWAREETMDDPTHRPVGLE
jgi:hypothetical protein